jgi:Spherulation-specific family 4
MNPRCALSSRTCLFAVVAVAAAACNAPALDSKGAPRDGGAGDGAEPAGDVTQAVDLAGADSDAMASIHVDGSFGASRTRMAVPAYFYPGPEWERLVAAAPTVGMIIFNPASGPGQASDPQYAKAVADAKAVGIVVLGYVFTNYGQRPSVDVLDDIKRYYDFYSPSGIYLAEGPMEADCGPMEAEYHAFADAARSRDARAYLAVGTRFCPTYVYFFDLMVQFARNWTEYQMYASPSWMPANSPERFCHFVNTVSGTAASEALSREVTNGAGWVFTTDESDPNPWGKLPSYFDDEVRAVSAASR